MTHGSASLPGWLFVVPWDIEHPGGVNQVVANLMRECASDGHYRPILLVADYAHAEPVAFGPGDLPRYRLRLPDPSALRGSVRARAGFVLNAAFALARLRGLLSRERIHVVNVHYVTPSAVLFGWLRRLGGRQRLLLSVHGTDVAAAFPEPSRNDPWCLSAARAADSIVTCSNDLARTLCTSAPELRGRTVAIHNGIDTDLLDRFVHTATPFPDAPPVIVTLGTFSEVKGHDVLVHAFAMVRQRHPGARLVIAGKAGPAQGATRSLVRELGLEACVDLRADQSHEAALALLAQATVFALPSRREAFGIAVIEAGALAKPVVASRVGGVPEIITDQEDGVLVPPDDPAALAAALEDLMEAPGKRQSLGAALQRRVLAHFPWRVAFERYRARAEDAETLGPDRA